MVGRDVADAVAAGLDGMHLDARQIGQDIGHALERRPVELDVLARGEMAVAAIVGARDVRQHAQLPGRQQAVRNRDPQHRREALDVQAVTQPQRPEFILAELAGQKAPGLVAKLRHPFVDQGLVDLIVSVHGVLCRGTVYHRRAARYIGLGFAHGAHCCYINRRR